LKNRPINKSTLVSVIGYGTFITRKLWEGKCNVEVCMVRQFSRITPLNSWFPYIIPSENSFWALKFDIHYDDLKILDQYEGVSKWIFQRIEIKVRLKSGKEIPAFLYVPTNNTISKEKLSLELDLHDRWKEELKKYPEIIKKFPELLY
jgi:hypothetical protein